MAAYDFRCRTCDTVFTVHHPIHEPATGIQCPHGHTDVTRVWSAVSMVGAAGSAGSGCACGGSCCCGG
ncbi:conserved hypothetical protein [Acidothermus cellulolyticus 11B]|uniref:Putative regulatory protein FmdB zinc ribbon domain-containing protein n=2 Tax=Acidothermus cellulolyticus TaxID=28049 RepID=A0LVN3_ACIC1|nr:conserved hypothetical protein [Acidothermus cellulolyticus 11B]MCL6550736.1 zinc ribbon domain-containing protein [Acidothermus cellulolyticus]